jgi:hypothetical protein
VYSFSRICSTVLVILGGGLASSAMAQSIHSGAATGSYAQDFCPQVERSLAEQYFEHKCVTSQGSGDNAAKVLANPVDVGLGQFDVVAVIAEENPGRLAFVDPGMGLECLYAVTSDPNITSLRGLPPRMPVALPPEASGSSATFRYLQTLDESLERMRSINYYPSAMDAVQAVAKREAGLAFFVQFPNTENPVFQAINEANLRFIPVVNRQILRREVGGVQVYQPREVTVTPSSLLGRLSGRSGQSVVTSCTPVVLFTGDPQFFPEGSEQRQDQLDVLAQLQKTAPPTRSDWVGILRNAVTVSRERIESLIQ